MSIKKVVVRSTAMYVPEKVMNNFDFEKIVDTTDEWIVQRTGIRERRFVGPGESSSTMAITVGKELVSRAGIDPLEVGLIVVPTVTPDYVFPPTAVISAAQIGCTNAFGWDVEGACGGFLHALYTAYSMLASGEVRYAMVIGSEVMTSIADYTDRGTCVLFGDAAAGFLLEGVDETEYGIKGFYMGADGHQWKTLYQPAGGCVNPPSHETVDNRGHFVKMDGQIVFKSAVKLMGMSVEKVLEKTGTPVEAIDFFVGHQANARIIESTRRRLGVPEEKMYVNIDRYGNTTAASIPLCVEELNAQGKLNPGTQLVMFTFGAGFVWGGCHLVWGA